MDIQYSVKPAGSEIRKEKIKSRLFGLFITLFIMSALFIKMFVFVPMLNEHPTFGDEDVYKRQDICCCARCLL